MHQRWTLSSLSSRTLFLVVLALCQFEVGYSQSYYSNKDIRFRHFQIKDGLPSNTIQCVLQGSNGFLWLGTQIGLVRYDGYDFHLLSQPSEIDDFERSSIHSLFEDMEGNIWVGTYRHGLYRYDPSRGNVIHFSTAISLNTPHSNVQDITQDPDGRLWVATDDGLMSLQPNSDNPSKFELTRFDTQDHPILRGISALQIRDDIIWAGCEHGLIKIIPKPGGACDFQQIELDENKGISINTIKSDQAKGLWLAGDIRENGQVIARGMVHYDVQSLETDYYKLPQHHYPIYDFEVDNGNFWIATRGDGISYIQENNINQVSPNDFEITHFDQYKFTSDQDFPIGRNHTYCIYIDKSASVWIGTWLQGLYQISPSVNIFTHHPLPKILPNENQTVFMVQKDGADKYWVSTYLNGLFHYNSSNQEFDSFGPERISSKGTGSSISMDLFRDSQNQLWSLGGHRTLNLYNPKAKEFANYRIGDQLLSEKRVPRWTDGAILHGIAEDQNGDFWIGSTGIGLCHFDPRSKSVIAHYLMERGDSLSLGSNNILRVKIDRNQNLWLSCDGQGLYKKITRPDGTIGFRSCTPIVNTIYSILDDAQGNLWLATLSDGLVKYHIKSGKTTHFTKKDGVPHKCVLDITQDPSSNNLWLITPQGLGYFDLSTETCQTFGAEYGLDFDQRLMNKGQVAGNEIILANINGFYSFNPDQLLTKKESPSTTLIKLHVFNQELTPATSKEMPTDLPYLEKLDLPYHQNGIAITYAGQYYDNPGQLQYSYYLEGLQSTWSEVQKERIARFPNLSPGAYQFNVRASVDGVLWGPARSLDIKIHPPWWQTNLAYALYLAAGLLGIYLSYRFLLDRKLQQAETKRLLELDEVKTGLYTNITHEFRTPLTVIIGMAKEILNNPKDWFREGLSMIISNGERVKKLTDEMLDLSKLEAGKLQIHLQNNDIISFLKFITGSFESFAQQKDVGVHFWSDEETLFMDFDRDKLTSILSNLLSNAVKFTSKGGDVYVRCQLQAKTRTLQLRIKDTGMGIHPAHLSSIFDRFYQAHDSKSVSPGGTGIGLALTKELVDLLGGHITVRSTVHKGTEFVIELPFTQTAASGTKIELAELDEKLNTYLHSESLLFSLPNESNDHPLILVVEDNDDIINYLTVVLKDHYALEIAKDGLEGWEKAIEKIPDMIISDVMMPQMDGFELCQKLKTDIRTSHIPIILLTAKADRSSKLEGLEHGADAYLLKPFDREELMIRLEKMIALRKSLQERIGLIPEKEVTTNLENAFISEVRHILTKHLDDEQFGILDLCRALGISRVQLHRKLKALTDQSTSIYIRQFKLEKASDMLRSSSKNIAEIAYAVGFKNPAYFTQVFTETYGYPPSTMRTL